MNYEARLPRVEEIFEAPVLKDQDFYSRQEAIISFQHPDHDTEVWPAKGVKI